MTRLLRQRKTVATESRTTVTTVDARRIFEAQRSLFARLYPEVSRFELHFVDSRCPTGRRSCASRDLAWMEGRGVYLLRRALELPIDQVRGLLAHELGHAADNDRHGPASEQRADNIAERALGRKVRYDARDVQTLGRGRWPRPARLHT